MDPQKIEDEALHLSREERTKLVQRLVLSLEAPSDEELQTEWLLEARRRANDLDGDAHLAIPAKDVLDRARAMVK